MKRTFGKAISAKNVAAIGDEEVDLSALGGLKINITLVAVNPLEVSHDRSRLGERDFFCFPCSLFLKGGGGGG